MRIAGLTTLLRSSSTYFTPSCWYSFMDDQHYLLEQKYTWIQLQSYIIHLAYWSNVQNFTFPVNFGADGLVTTVLSFLGERKYSEFGFSKRLNFSVIRFFFSCIQKERSKILFHLYVMPGERNPTLWPSWFRGEFVRGNQKIKPAKNC